MATPTPDVETYAFAVDEYVTSLRAADRSEKTISTYLWALDGLAKFSSQVALTDVFSPGNIERYLVKLADSGLSSGSRAGAFRSLKAFGNWCERRGLVVTSPTKKVTAPRNEPRLKVLLEDAELAKLYDACRGKSSPDIRDMAMLRLFVTTGLRRGEVCNLLISDWDRVEHTVTVRSGKTRSSRRSVYVPAATEQALMAWLRERSRFLNRNGLPNPEDGPLFIALGRNSGQKLSGAGLHHLIWRRAKLAGINVHPHQLRHGFAHWSLASGLPELVVASALGHTSTALLASTYGAFGRQGRSLAAYAALDGRRSRAS